MQKRRQHQGEVLAFLQGHVSRQNWELTLPGSGWGNETYFAHSAYQDCFIKLNAQTERYRAVAAIDMTPPLLTAGVLNDGTPIIVQPLITGKKPSRFDYRSRLAQFATAVHKFHHSSEVQAALPQVPSGQYNALGLDAIAILRSKWEHHRSQVSREADFIDECLDHLEQQVRGFTGSGVVASHNDINNSNWLITSDGQLYILDLELMSLDDPALDIGATLWWYYHPDLRREFLEKSGYSNDASFDKRMQVRMAMHCLNIILPREGSFDQFDPDSFPDSLTDFKAIFAGEENPQGYED